MRHVIRYLVIPYFRVSFFNLDEVRKLERPYLVLPNHSGFFDPFFINAPISQKFHYVVSDTQFRSPVMRYLLGMTGAIPITKNTNDLKSLKKMTDASRAGQIVGIFPEGLRNWDGETLPIIESTAKLVRMFNVPVVVPLLEGAYLMDPRWGRTLRRGKVVITYKILFGGQKPGRLKIDDIVREIKEALEHSEFESEVLRGVKFKGRKRAEKIEQIVYICPECHAISSFRSKGNDFSCGACGYSVHYTEEGRFRSPSGKDYFDNMALWNKWQKKEVVKILLKDHGDEPVFSDCNLIHSMPDEKGRFIKRGKGCLYFYKDKIEYRDGSGYLYIYELEGITGMNVQLHERLEFFYEKELHRFHSREKIFSARKVNDFYESSLNL
ncbi:MAG: 1-acyl-sn-glycerol-3-phosphate acyltransferase [Spirochaetales bacterium]|nr:1-acyl-sn-glycerol-3-phosphate acyltransferase [Spirochaetales bacterium]